MDIIKFYTDHSIPYHEEGEGHHAGPGWVQINCPFCDDPSDHLGYNLRENYFNCYRCGSHPINSTIARLLNIPETDVPSIVHQYGGYKGQSIPSSRKISRPTTSTIHKERTAVQLPSGTSALTLRHKTYLRQRGFDPDQLEEEWGLMGTGPVAPLNGIDYRHRIIAPIYWQGEMVSFQARDITGQQEPRYMFCPPEIEILPSKNLLYGKNIHKEKDFGILVEGITDAWRFGEEAFATFGTQVTVTQMYQIAKTFRNIAIVFDPDAREQADKLQTELFFRGVLSIVFHPDKDPGAMTQEEAGKFMRRLMI
jgi:hypothetical protein